MEGQGGGQVQEEVAAELPACRLRRNAACAEEQEQRASVLRAAERVAQPAVQRN